MEDRPTQPSSAGSCWSATGRLVVFCAVAGAILVFWVQRRSLADRYFPSRISTAAEEANVDKLTVNGQQFSSTIGSSALPLTDVIDSFQKWCRPRAGSLLEWKEALISPQVQTDEAAATYPLVRFDDGKTGMATCVFLGQDPRVDVNARLLAAVRHDDIGLVGQVRHIYAYDNGAGTSYLVLWSKGSLRLDQFLPETGDVPGSDPAGLPLPADAQRAISGSSEIGKRVSSYVSAASADSLRVAYESSLASSGWRMAALDGVDGPGTVAFRGRRVLWILLDEQPGLGTVTTVVDDFSADQPAAPQELSRP